MATPSCMGQQPGLLLRASPAPHTFSTWTPIPNGHNQSHWLGHPLHSAHPAAWMTILQWASSQFPAPCCSYTSNNLNGHTPVGQLSIPCTMLQLRTHPAAWKSALSFHLILLLAQAQLQHPPQLGPTAQRVPTFSAASTSSTGLNFLPAVTLGNVDSGKGDPVVDLSKDRNLLSPGPYNPAAAISPRVVKKF